MNLVSHFHPAPLASSIWEWQYHPYALRPCSLGECKLSVWYWQIRVQFSTEEMLHSRLLLCLQLDYILKISFNCMIWWQIAHLKTHSKRHVADVRTYWDAIKLPPHFCDWFSKITSNETKSKFSFTFASMPEAMRAFFVFLIECECAQMIKTIGMKSKTFPKLINGHIFNTFLQLEPKILSDMCVSCTTMLYKDLILNEKISLFIETWKNRFLLQQHV